MTGQLREWLNTGERAGEPSDEPVAGKFDDDTSQFHDIRKELQEDGTWKYFAILVDAEGRSREVLLVTEDEKKHYLTLQRIKKYPLADQVRRELVMPLLEKITPDLRRAPVSPLEQ